MTTSLATLDSLLPANSDAERSILGAILLDNLVYMQAAAMLKPHDFSLDAHRRIYGHMIALAESGRPVDYVTLAEELGRNRELEAIGGVAYLASLTDGLPRVSNIEHYIRIVQDKALLRALIDAANRTIAAAVAQDDSGEQVLSSAEAEFLQLRANDSGNGVIASAECWEDAYQQLETRASSDGQLVGLSVGIENVDVATTGIREHQLWVLAGRTGEGKSCIAAQTIVANCKNDIPVLLVTPEMDRSQVMERLSIQISGVPSWKFAKPNFMSKQDLEMAKSAMQQIGKWPFYLDDSSSLTVQEIAARARLAVRRNGVKLVIVDYVQLIEAKGRDEKERVSNVSRYLRGLAKQVVPVLALSQMPRPDKKNLNKWPTKYDLKESGSLENDASGILLIMRKVSPETNLPTREDYIVIPKQRFGPVGFEKVLFDDDTLTYRPRTEDPQ